MKMSVNERMRVAPSRRRSLAGRRRVAPRSVVATATSTPSRSLNEPEAATCSPAARPVEDHDLVAEHRRRSARGRSCARGLAVLARRDHEHVVAGRSLAQRAHGDGDGRARRADRDAHAHRRAGRGRARRRRSARAPWRCASSGRRARRRDDRRGDRRRRRSSTTTSTVSPSRSARGDALGDGEVDVHGVVDALQRRELACLRPGTGPGARRPCRRARGTARGSSCGR